MNLIFSYHPMWIALAFLLAAFLTFVLYKKDNLLSDISKSVKLLLASLRFFSIFCIALLLIGIILEHFITKTEKPIVFIVHDNSESVIQNKDSVFYKTKYPTDLKVLSKSLHQKFDIINYSFDQTIKDSISSNYTGKLSNISAVFDQIYSQYSNQNIGAIVLSTDGIYNTGSNPIYSVNRKTYVPVYTIGLGDTNEVKDCKIDKVYNNDIAFLGNEFPVQINVSQVDCENNTVKVGIYKNNKLIKSKTIVFKSNKEDHKIDFVLKASQIGFVKYTVKVEKINGEFSYKNNEANFYIDVIDGRQKIALAYSGLHPDLGAISYVIENNKNYEVKLIPYKNLTNLNDFDLIICHNYKNENAILNKALKAGEKTVLFIVGVNSNLTDLSNLQIGFKGVTSKTEDIQLSMNGNFNTIIYPPNIANTISKAPPLKSPFGGLKFSKSLDVMAYQKIGNINLEQPLIYFSEKNNSKYGVIMGEGIWRWRLFDQFKNQTTENFELLLSKIISYLAVKENKNPFKVHVNNEYAESDEILIHAELYNSSYDLINTPEVNFSLTNSKNKVFEYHFFKTSNAYKLDLGKLEQGIYNWQANTTFSGKRYKSKGSFLVKEVKKEYLNITANHRLLKNISENTNGKFYLPNELNNLSKNILNRDDIVTTSYNEKSFKDLIDYKWLFFFIIILLSIEWFIRKYSGAY